MFLEKLTSGNKVSNVFDKSSGGTMTRNLGILHPSRLARDLRRFSRVSQCTLPEASRYHAQNEPYEILVTSRATAYFYMGKVKSISTLASLIELMQLAPLNPSSSARNHLWFLDSRSHSIHLCPIYRQRETASSTFSFKINSNLLEIELILESLQSETCVLFFRTYD